MVIIYLSDASVETLRTMSIPSPGEHIGEEFSKVLHEVQEWRQEAYQTQVVATIEVRFLQQLSRSRIKPNTPASELMVNILQVLQMELTYDLEGIATNGIDEEE